MPVDIRDLVACIACCGIAVALGVGAYTDWKTRTIPNWIPLAVFLCGCFTAATWSTKLFSLLAICVVLWFISTVTHQRSGGGDVKLYMSIAFALGLQSLSFILIATLCLCRGHQVVQRRKLGKGERIPLCCYVFPAYLIELILMMH